MMQKVMITGGLGFVGSHLTRYLTQRNRSVQIVSRSKNSNYEKLGTLQGVQIKIKSITDLDASDFKDVGLVYHLASTVHNYHILDDPFLDCNTNIVGTLHILNILKELPHIQFILASSWFVYGHPERLPVDENAICRPLALYGSTKLCSEHCAQTFGRVFDIKYKIVRFANVYGPGDINADKKKGALVYLLDRIKNNEPVSLYYGGDFVRDYIYVEDAVKGLVHVAEEGTNGQVYNIGSGAPTRFNEIIDFGMEYFKSHSTITSVEPPAFHKAVQTKDFYFNIARLKSIGFQPETSLQEGLGYVCQHIS